MILTVLCKQDGIRADALIAGETELSRTAAARLCEEGRVTLSGKAIGKKDLLKAGDILEVGTDDPTPDGNEPEDIPLDVVYEDDDLIVVNKPKGMVVHPAAGNPRGTLVNALLFHCRGQLSGIGGVERPGIVHRIDKDTAGLIVAAKNDATHRALADQMAYHGVSRVYHALAIGGFRETSGTVDAPIGRNPNDRKKMAVIRDGVHRAREAVTHYEVLRDFGDITYIKCVLETGRTHQIRVHMAHIGHPLLGDTLYGGGKSAFGREHAKRIEGQCLFAKELSFVHPATGETVHFEVPLPDDFRHLLDILENR